MSRHHSQHVHEITPLRNRQITQLKCLSEDFCFVSRLNHAGFLWTLISANSIRTWTCWRRTQYRNYSMRANSPVCGPKWMEVIWLNWEEGWSGTETEMDRAGGETELTRGRWGRRKSFQANGQEEIKEETCLFVKISHFGEKCTMDVPECRHVRGTITEIYRSIKTIEVIKLNMMRERKKEVFMLTVAAH